MTEPRFRRSQNGRRERGKRAGVMLALSCAIVTLSALPLGAQLTVDRLEIFSTPSATARVMSSFVVRNTGKEPAQATVTREDWSRQENGENQFAPSGSTPGSCRDRINVFPVSFRIEPGATQVVRIPVEAAGSTAKECWEIVMVQELPRKSESSKSSLQYIFRTGVKVYVTPDSLRKDASIAGMTFDKKNVTIRFANDGQVHLAAKGRIEFRNLDNSVAVQASIPEFAILPGAVRRLDVAIPAGLRPGQYIALALIDFGGSEIAAGQLEMSTR
ncbi:MAG TPA: fimbria/pilus periplasmic chaperone [Gemmatimonadaceae bacterium]|nr:fimbria/pilus periplasmic chaperone [Gemmatimonadaceae bacterium]